MGDEFRADHPPRPIAGLDLILGELVKVSDSPYENINKDSAYSSVERRFFYSRLGLFENKKLALAIDNFKPDRRNLAQMKIDFFEGDCVSIKSRALPNDFNPPTLCLTNLFWLPR